MFRQVHTKIWTDNWFIQLTPEGKLLFLYLITNERASIAGIYELPLAVMSFESGLALDIVKEQLAVFELAEKVFYDHEASVVWVVNLRKYHETGSDKLLVKIFKDISAVPDCPVLEAYCKAYGIDRVSIGYKYKYTSTSTSDSLSMSDRSFEGRRPSMLGDSPPDQMVAALAEVTGMDAYVRGSRTALNNAAVQLVERYKAEDVIKRYGPDGTWYDAEAGHWKGKKGQRPSLIDITMTIGNGPFSLPNGKPEVKSKAKAKGIESAREEIENRFGELDY